MYVRCFSRCKAQPEQENGSGLGFQGKERVNPLRECRKNGWGIQTQAWPEEVAEMEGEETERSQGMLESVTPKKYQCYCRGPQCVPQRLRTGLLESHLQTLPCMSKYTRLVQ